MAIATREATCALLAAGAAVIGIVLDADARAIAHQKGRCTGETDAFITDLTDVTARSTSTAVFHAVLSIDTNGASCCGATTLSIGTVF